MARFEKLGIRIANNETLVDSTVTVDGAGAFATVTPLRPALVSPL